MYVFRNANSERCNDTLDEVTVELAGEGLRLLDQ